MIIFKCFTCSYETNNNSYLRNKELGQTYVCPECEKSLGCLVETETQIEFPNDYVYEIITNKDRPIYYGKKVEDLDNNNVKILLQVFELINIKDSIFEYGFINVPGMFHTIGSDMRKINAENVAIINIVGRNVLDNIESRNYKNQLNDYETKTPDSFSTTQSSIDLSEYEKLKQRNKLLVDENFDLLNKVSKLDLYKILTFDIEYLLSCDIGFKKIYKLPKPTKNRIIKKYEATEIISYGDYVKLNVSWDKDKVYYLDIPDLNHIEEYLRKAWNSGAVCCGVVPFAPYTDWYKYYIAQRADGNPIKEQKGIPFPCIEFSFRHDKEKPKKDKNIADGLLTKTDKKLGQQMFGFAKREKK